MQDKRRWLPRWQRIELAEKCELEGFSRRPAAAWRRVSPATVQCWVERRRAASGAQIASGEWADDRPSTPRRQPRLTSAADHERVCAARRRTGWGPRLQRLMRTNGIQGPGPPLCSSTDRKACAALGSFGQSRKSRRLRRHFSHGRAIEIM